MSVLKVLAVRQSSDFGSADTASVVMHRTSHCQQREQFYCILLQLPLKNTLSPEGEKLFVL